MEPNPPQKSKPKPDTRMLVGRRLQSRLRMEDQEEGESSTCSRDHGWKEKNQAQEDTRKGKRHLHSKKQMVQMTGRSLHVTSGTLGKHSLLTFHTYTSCIITSQHPEGETTSSLHLSPVPGPPAQISGIRLQVYSLESLNRRSVCEGRESSSTGLLL